MDKDQLLALGLDEATAGRVAAASAEELRGFVPQARLDEALSERDAARADLQERDKRLDMLGQAARDADALRDTVRALQSDSRRKDAEHAAEVTRLKLSSAVDAALTAAGARSLPAARALLALDGAELDEAGRVKGLSEQIGALKASAETGFLFAQEQPRFRGARAGETGPRDGGPPAAELNYGRICAYLEEHPEATV